MTDYSLSDVASVVGRNEDYNSFGGGAWWLIVLFLFAFTGNGFGNHSNANGEPVTEAGLCNAMNFNNLENAVGRLSDQTESQTMTLGTAISDLGKEVALGQANLQQQISKENFDIQKSIDAMNYNNALNTAAINKNIDDKFAALEKMQLEQTINAQTARINQLELAQQMNNVIRYPTSYAYSAGQSPFCGGCCANI